MITHRFGGQRTLLDAPTGVTLQVKVWGELRGEIDEATAQWTGGVIFEVFDRVAMASPKGAAKFCGDPASFPTAVEPAVRQELQQRGAAPVQIGSFNTSIAPESIAELKAVAARAKDGPSAAPAPFVVGSTVLVQWSDGNRYPGTVQATAPGQIQVGFANGQSQWIPAAYVTAAPT